MEEQAGETLRAAISQGDLGLVIGLALGFALVVLIIFGTPTLLVIRSLLGKVPTGSKVDKALDAVAEVRADIDELKDAVKGLLIAQTSAAQELKRNTEIVGRLIVAHAGAPQPSLTSSGEGHRVAL